MELLTKKLKKWVSKEHSNFVGPSEEGLSEKLASIKEEVVGLAHIVYHVVVYECKN
jgi:hypothetical protein|nr:MAG: hypothetical protein [Microviridae sp.]